MARVTVEDCVDKVPNRFELVLLAAHRARAITNGAAITIDPDNDKNPVVALREIAERTVPAEDMRESPDPFHPEERRSGRAGSRRGTGASAGAAQPDPRSRRPVRRHQVDVLTEEQLLRGLESMTPSEPSSNGGSGGPRERGR